MVSKRLCLLLAALLLTCALPALAAPDPLPLTEEDLVFSFEGQDYALNTEAKPLLAALKKAGIKLEENRSASCLFDGSDKEYVSDVLLLGTLPKGNNGADVLETIVVIGDDFLTKRGVGNGNSQTEVQAAYGPPSLLDYDLMIYYLQGDQEGPRLVFELDPDVQVVVGYYYFYNTQI